MKKTHPFLLLLAIAFASCDSSTPTTKTNTTTTEEVAASKPAEVWQYSEDIDKMTNEKKYYAIVNATNTLEFKFPYQGGTSIGLVLRNMGKGNEVKLGVDKGQFMPSIMGDKNVRVKFDDEAPVNYSYSGTSDGSANSIFINNENKFIAKLKKANKLMIEAEFYQEGNQIMYFDVAGLTWEHK